MVSFIRIDDQLKSEYLISYAIIITLYHLKEIEGFNIPVIVLTVSENERDTFVGYYGFDEYITKLLTQEKVKETFPKIINDLKFIKIEKQKSNKS